MNKFGISYYSMQSGSRIPLSGLDVRILRPGQTWDQGIVLAESSPGSAYYEITLLSDEDCGYYEIWDNRSGTGAFSGKTQIIGKVDYRALQVGAVSQDRIANSAVSHDKLAQEAVRDIHVLGGTISTQKLADLAVTSQKLANDAVTTPKIEDRAVDGSKIAYAAIAEPHLDDGAVTTPKIEDAAVTLAKLAPSVLSVLPLVYTMDKGTAKGNVSDSIPPDYSVDDRYTHTFDYSGSVDPVVLIEQRAVTQVQIYSLSYSGISQGLNRLTVVVQGEAGRAIDYRLLIMVLN